MQHLLCGQVPTGMQSTDQLHFGPVFACAVYGAFETDSLCHYAGAQIDVAYQQACTDVLAHRLNLEGLCREETSQLCSGLLEQMLQKL